MQINSILVIIFFTHTHTHALSLSFLNTLSHRKLTFNCQTLFAYISFKKLSFSFLKLPFRFSLSNSTHSQITTFRHTYITVCYKLTRVPSSQPPKTSLLQSCTSDLYTFTAPTSFLSVYFGIHPTTLFIFSMPYLIIIHYLKHFILTNSILPSVSTSS